MSYKRDYNLIAFTWYNLCNEFLDKRPTQQDFRKILKDFNRGCEKKSDNKHLIVTNKLESKKYNSRIIKQYL